MSYNLAVINVTADGMAPVMTNFRYHIDGLVQDCSLSIAKALEMLESCIKPSMFK